MASLATVDTILLGRKTYELFVDFWPNATTHKEVIADNLNETDKIIFTNTLTKASWGKGKSAQVIPGEATTAIKKLKDLSGKDMVMWGSISLAQSLMKKNLVDEYRLQLCPWLPAVGSFFHKKWISHPLIFYIPGNIVPALSFCITL